MNLFKEKLLLTKIFFNKLYHKYQSDYYNEKYFYKEILINENDVRCFIPFTISKKINKLFIFLW